MAPCGHQQTLDQGFSWGWTDLYSMAFVKATFRQSALVVMVMIQYCSLIGASHAEQQVALGGAPSQPHCAVQCRCLDKASIITCRNSGLVRIPSLLSTALVLDLDHNHITILTNDSFYNVPRLEILSLEDNGIMYLEAGIFSNLIELRILRLGKNQLTYLPSDAFKHNQNLEVLDLHQNRFRGPIPDSMAASLHSLQIFNMSYNDLDSPHLGAGFRYTTRLSVLDLSGNNFVSLESQVFQAAQSWDNGQQHFLNLSYCNIHHIHPHAFTSLNTIESISLEGNPDIPLSELETALKDLEVSNLQVINLSHMNISDMYNLFRSFRHRNLLEIYISYNKIRIIHQRTFFYLVNLRILDLSHNEISDIRDLTGLSRLQTFNLAYNKLAMLDSNDLGDLQDLRVLDLSHNLMLEVDSMPFMNLFSLQSLDLSANRLSRILFTSGLESLGSLRASDNQLTQIQFVRGLPHIKILDLSNNYITRLGPNVFTRGQHLAYANFSGNSIHDIHPTAFQDSLQTVLDLSHNQLKSLTYVGWSSMDSLHLEYNQLYNVSATTFAGLTSLQKLHLQGNNLFAFPPDTFRDLINVKYLDLSKNPLGSYLGGSKGAALISQLRKLQSLKMSHVDLRDLPPTLLANLSMLTSLNLSGNSLQNLGTTNCGISSLPRLQTLDISNNLLPSPDPRCFTSRKLTAVDFSRNPLSCSCDLMPLHNWILTNDNVTVVNLEDTSAYYCVSPLEWKGVWLVHFQLDEASCSYHEKAIIFTAIGCTLVALILLVTVAIFRYKWWYRRKLAQTRYSFIDDNLNNGLGSMSMNGSAISTECGSTVVTNRTSREWV